MLSMNSYTQAAMERAMKVQEVMLQAMAKKISWWQAAEILGITDRHMRRWRERYEEFGFRGLFDRRRGRPSPKRVPVAIVERVLALYRECYFDLNVRHFHEKLSRSSRLSEISVPGKGGCRKSCARERLLRWRRRTVFCGKSTSPSSTGDSRYSRRRPAALSPGAGSGIWSRFFRCSSNAR